MAEEIAKGARSEGAVVELYQVPELLPCEGLCIVAIVRDVTATIVLNKSGAAHCRALFKHIPEANPEDLVEADV